MPDLRVQTGLSTVTIKNTILSVCRQNEIRVISSATPVRARVNPSSKLAAAGGWLLLRCHRGHQIFDNIRMQLHFVKASLAPRLDQFSRGNIFE